MADTAIDIATIRADFPILSETVHGRSLIYLDNAATTQKPRAVLDRLVAFYSRSNSNVHRGAHYLSEIASEQYEDAREAVRRFLNARQAREIIFTHGTTESVNTVARGFEHRIAEGDEVIVTELEHHSNLIPWQMLCRRTGALLKAVPFDDDGSLHAESLGALLTDRTRLLALSHVSNVLGVVNPVAELIGVAHQRGVPVLLDAAQSVQHLAIDVQELDCDFLVFSGHKAYAGNGIGVLYGKEEWLERMEPSRYGGGMVDSVGLQQTTFTELPFRLEAGTPNIAGAVSLDAAIEYLTGIGMDAIHGHEQEIMQHAMQRFSELDGVRIYGTAPPKCGALSFNLERADPFDVAMILDKLGIAVRAGTHCAEPAMKHFDTAGAVRASFALYNTLDEIDALVDGIRKAQDMLL